MTCYGIHTRDTNWSRFLDQSFPIHVRCHAVQGWALPAQGRPYTSTTHAAEQQWGNRNRIIFSTTSERKASKQKACLSLVMILVVQWSFIPSKSDLNNHMSLFSETCCWCACHVTVSIVRQETNGRVKHEGEISQQSWWPCTRSVSGVLVPSIFLGVGVSEG